jgi:hypothetical protein
VGVPFGVIRSPRHLIRLPYIAGVSDCKSCAACSGS